MDRLQAMTAFLTVVDSGGFASAARKLNVSPSVVTRAVVELEERLGARLLTRTTRVVRVTEAGTAYADSCRRILADVEDAESAASGTHAAARGQLTVSAPVNFGRMYVEPIVRRYLAQYPQVDMKCWYMDRVVSLVDEGVDVAIRIGELPDSTLQAIQVGRVRQVLCASPGYLRAHGQPQHPDDLQRHVIISATGITPMPEWRFRDTQVRLQPRLTTTTNEAAAQSAAADFGITRLPLYHVAQAVKDGTLEIVLEAFERPAVPLSVVHREGRHVSQKVRAFVDMAVDALRSDLNLR